ncbi:hypothetical protein AM501_11055 [Aneurinibacillus migulanus]|uniref:Uncharacterized protein n=1 Tax=Aneurinibacillus migulanus TaxID=47500 RepID=A0A0D1XVZ8_ANEMI|nr:hypothetical protein TS65_28045 [Aneurinibacillus migulanus]KIV51606.1 hypothetical protein TS64_22850 [Aneurinibacillus migulanus]KON94705.1 hypothetical protein AF333_03615 [Aneurinibacillus migulanus]KPD08262.1 hypothetical protein AM501_11055 [Aneurinibacillus migulanus]SDJ13551.1 hypothetical protein SAMN04487909_112107 [Aneurinibacillus migulanus]
MDVLSTIGYAIVSYISVYTLLMILGAVVFTWLTIWFYRRWRKDERVYKRNAAYIRERQREMYEWSESCREQQRNSS